MGEVMMRAQAIETKRLRLVPRTVEEARAAVDAMPAAEKAQVSADWLAKLNDAEHVDSWTLGFTAIELVSGREIGQAGFKGPPGPDGMVEIAYGIHPDFQEQGYATEAAAALVQFALARAEVQIVRAHTLPEPNASGRVLTKCGFSHVGEIIDPEDGRVWRWEKRREIAGASHGARWVSG